MYVIIFDHSVYHAYEHKYFTEQMWPWTMIVRIWWQEMCVKWQKMRNLILWTKICIFVGKWMLLQCLYYKLRVPKVFTFCLVYLYIVTGLWCNFSGNLLFEGFQEIWNTGWSLHEPETAKACSATRQVSWYVLMTFYIIFRVLYVHCTESFWVCCRCQVSSEMQIFVVILGYCSSVLAFIFELKMLYVVTTTATLTSLL